MAPGEVGGTGKGGWYWERWVAPGAENGGGTGSDCIAKKKPTEEQPQCRSSVGLSCVSRTDSARRVLKPPFLSRHRQVTTAGANFPRRGWLATSHCLPKHRTTAMQRTSRICITYATEKIGVIATIRPTKNRHKQLTTSGLRRQQTDSPALIGTRASRTRDTLLIQFDKLN